MIFFSIESNAPFAAERLTALMDQLTDLGMNVSNKKASQLHMLMDNKNPAMGALAKRYCEELRERIEHELDGKAIYFVSSRIELFEAQEPLFGATVDEKFPSARFDIGVPTSFLGRSGGSPLALRKPFTSHFISQ
jgi:hypothetical protein